MRTRTLKLLGLLAAFGLLPIGARALDVTGGLGFGYTRADTWTPGMDRVTAPRLDLDLHLNASGSVERRGFLDWGLGGAYRRVTDEVNGATTGQSELLLYRAAATLFGDGRKPLTLSFNASRQDSSRLTDPNANVFGSFLLDSWGGGLQLRAEHRPSLDASFTRSEGRDKIAGLTTHTVQADDVSAALAHGAGGHSLRATYLGRFSSGSWATDDLDLHIATVDAQSRFTKNITARLTDRFMLRVPHATGPGTFGQENNSLSLFVGNGQPVGDQQTVRYLYLRAITDPTSTLYSEVTRQSIGYEGDFSLDGRPLVPAREFDEGTTLFAHVRVDGSLNRTSTQTTVADSMGETLAPTVYWRKRGGGSDYEVNGGPVVALLQPEQGGSKFGWGLNAGGRLGRPLWGQAFAVGYGANFGSRVYGADGWSLTQTLSARATGLLGGGHYSGSLNASAVRTSSPSLGEGAGRTVEARFSNSYRRFYAELRGVLTDGIVGATPKEFVSDGLLIPAPFDSSTRELHLRAGTNYRGLKLTGEGVFISNEIPGSPTIRQTQAYAAIEYSLAAIDIRVEDRMIWYAQGSGGRNNLFMIWLSRRLGLRF